MFEENGTMISSAVEDTYTVPIRQPLERYAIMETCPPAITTEQQSENRAASSIARCVCGWKNCRTFQKAFREAKQPTWDGVIKLKFATDHAESMALKTSIDQYLKVPAERANDWKPGKRDDQQVIRYTIARHHFTEKHILRYLEDPKNYSFLKPFSVHGAKKYLYTVDPSNTVRRASSDRQEVMYLQCPNVPKEAVKAVFYKVKETMYSKRSFASNHSRSNPSKTMSFSNAEVWEMKQSERSQDSMTESAWIPAVSAHRIQSSTMIALKDKEDENKHLKDQLETMQSQLAFLHDWVCRLQEETFDHVSVHSGSVRGSRSELTEDWTSAGPYVDDDDNNKILTNTQDDDDATYGTFQVTYRAQRRNSNESHMSKSISTIVSTSRSVKTLPREIVLDKDENDSEFHESLTEEAFMRSFNTRSFASTNQCGYSGAGSSINKNSLIPGFGPCLSPKHAAKHQRSMGPNCRLPRRSPSNGSMASAQSVRSGRSPSKQSRRTSADGTVETDETSGSMLLTSP